MGICPAVTLCSGRADASADAKQTRLEFDIQSVPSGDYRVNDSGGVGYLSGGTQTPFANNVICRAGQYSDGIDAAHFPRKQTLACGTSVAFRRSHHGFRVDVAAAGPNGIFLSPRSDFQL